MGNLLDSTNISLKAVLPFHAMNIARAKKEGIMNNIANLENSNPDNDHCARGYIYSNNNKGMKDPAKTPMAALR